MDRKVIRIPCQFVPATVIRSLASIASLGGLMLSGCKDAVGPSDVRAQPNAPFQTSALTYRLADDGTVYHVIVPLTYVNHTSGPVYQGWCASSLERKAGKRWVRVFAPTCPTGGQVTNTYEVGLTYHLDFSIWGTHVSNAGPSFLVSPAAGIHRIVYALYRKSTPIAVGLAEGSDPLDLSERVSNEFWLDLP